MVYGAVIPAGINISACISVLLLNSKYPWLVGVGGPSVKHQDFYNTDGMKAMTGAEERTFSSVKTMMNLFKALNLKSDDERA